jgi:hypothetical protein
MAAGSGYETGPNGGFEQIAAATPKRYGAAAGFTATTGPVDKLGYQDREVRRRARQKRIQGMISPTPTPAVPGPVLSGMGQWTGPK